MKFKWIIVMMFSTDTSVAKRNIQGNPFLSIFSNTHVFKAMNAQNFFRLWF